MDNLGIETPTTRTIPLGDYDLREEGDGMNFRGYAAVFNSFSDDLGGFREQIAPNAFDRSLNAAMNGKRTIKMFLNHNADIVLASTRGKTLKLSTDERGLLAEARLPNSEWGHSAAEAIRRGDIDSMSFGFQVEAKGDKWNDDNTERTLHAVRLWEVSPVTSWPAYAATTASVRHLAEEIGEEEEPLADAFRVLASQDDKLTPEQRELLLRAINARTDTPLISAEVAARLARLEARPAALL
jgi:HK97 family phage prohead protease